MKLQPVQKIQRPLSNPMSEQRGGDRIPLSFGLMYSGLDDSDVIMGDGTVVDLSRGGLGIRGNQPVKAGMELTLFLYLPDKEDPLFIVQTQVAWVHGHRFGVQLQHMTAREEHRLHRFLQSLSRTIGKA
jgi:Tfp pilus assembly protein PilZ